MPRRRSNIYEKQIINQYWLLQIIQDEYRLNPEQKNVYDIILSSVNSNEGKIFF